MKFKVYAVIQTMQKITVSFMYFSYVISLNDIEFITVHLPNISVASIYKPPNSPFIASSLKSEDSIQKKKPDTNKKKKYKISAILK